MNISTSKFQLLVASLLTILLQRNIVISEFTNKDEVFNVVNGIEASSKKMKKTETETAIELTPETVRTEIANLELPNYYLTAIEEENANDNIFNVNGVVGGRYSSFGGYPFYASILVFNVKKNQWEPICGGALIHSNWVLSAAHCIVAGYQYAVEIGRYAYNSGNGGQFLEKRKASILCTNPKFDSMKVMQDFGLLYFDEPSVIEPARLDIGKIDYRELYPFVILGFGSTQSSGKGSFPEFLQEGDVYYVDNDKCGNEWSEYIDTSVLCSSSHGSGDSCKGDSGGPLIVNDGTEYQDYLAGIVSYGPVPCDGSVPVLYGRVAYAQDWIERVVTKRGDTSKCGKPITFSRRRKLLRSYEKMTGFKNGSFGDFFEKHNEE